MNTIARLARALTLLLYTLSVGFVLSGCSSTSYQVAGNVERGRPQLIWGDPKVALASFQQAAELDPDYRYNFSILSEGVWSYVGRAYYQAGNIPEARKALEKDLSRYSDDYLAQLYLGMVSVKEGNRTPGLKDLQTALQSLNEWLDYIHKYHPEGALWDPARALRSDIREQLVMISAIETSLPELISRAEDLGKKFEREIDFVRRDKFRFESQMENNR